MNPHMTAAEILLRDRLAANQQAQDDAAQAQTITDASLSARNDEIRRIFRSRLTAWCNHIGIAVPTGQPAIDNNLMTTLQWRESGRDFDFLARFDARSWDFHGYIVNLLPADQEVVEPDDIAKAEQAQGNRVTEYHNYFVNWLINTGQTVVPTFDIEHMGRDKGGTGAIVFHLQGQQFEAAIQENGATTVKIMLPYKGKLVPLGDAITTEAELQKVLANPGKALDIKQKEDEVARVFVKWLGNNHSGYARVFVDDELIVTQTKYQDLQLYGFYNPGKNAFTVYAEVPPGTPGARKHTQAKGIDLLEVATPADLANVPANQKPKGKKKK